jgi:hypothetical protein
LVHKNPPDGAEFTGKPRAHLITATPPPEDRFPSAGHRHALPEVLPTEDALWPLVRVLGDIALRIARGDGESPGSNL